ncbi:MAG TPA: hypothetical protein VET65_05180 [Candidatus Limnocylindrales bacterium]|nr:hypothetical protein [Candidatus Limnocylindrales bacterium]
MVGLLAQTNATIRDAERRHRELQAHRDQMRRPVGLIDRMLQDLEELNLRGQKRVPMAFEPRLQELHGLLDSTTGLSGHLENLKVKIGISKLMDALFAIQEALFSERHGAPMEPDPDDLIYAA